MADIFGVRVAPDLSVLDSLIIICNDAGGQTNPSVVFNGQHYIAVWADAFVGSRDITLRAVRIDPQGHVIGSGVSFGSGSGMTDIAFDGDRCLVVWSKTYQGVFGRFLNAEALPEDTVFRIDTIVGSETRAHIDFDGTHYLVVWSDFDSVTMEQDIFGRMISPAGVVGEERIAITRLADHQVNPDLSFNGENHLVVWIEASGMIRGRFVAPDGQLVGGVVEVSDTTSFARDHVASAVGTANHCIVWSEWRSEYDVYGNCDIVLDADENRPSAPGSLWKSTVIAGPLIFDRAVWKAFDVTGRQVSDPVPAKGVYFLRHENGTVLKVVKIR